GVAENASCGILNFEGELKCCVCNSDQRNRTKCFVKDQPESGLIGLERLDKLKFLKTAERKAQIKLSQKNQNERRAKTLNRDMWEDKVQRKRRGSNDINPERCSLELLKDRKSIVWWKISNGITNGTKKQPEPECFPEEGIIRHERKLNQRQEFKRIRKRSSMKQA
ncbi:hypothetical protein ACTXT7_017332, partial [Hymenolepis weldensis]